MFVSQVTDGDTVRLETGERVRLVGINAFEMKSTGWQGRYARQARGRVEAMVPRSIQLTPWPAPTDRYGRLLANIWLGESYVAEHLVGDGLALSVQVPPNVRLANCLREHEVRAQTLKHGVWALDVLPLSLSELDDLGGFQDLVGQVTRIEQGRTPAVILDERLRVEWLRDLAIPATGEQVRVRGWVGRASKPHRSETPWRLRVLHPNNVEVPFKKAAEAK